MEGLFLKIVEMSISAGFIALGILLIRLFMRKASKWINVAVWCLVGIRLCLPFSFESELSVVPNTEQGIVSIAESLDKETVTKTETITETEDIIASQNSGEISQEVIGNPTVSPEPDVKVENETTQNAVVSTTPETVTTVVTETKNTENSKTIINIVVIVWLAGILAMLTYMIVSYAKIYFRIREGFAEGNRIILCDRISSPFVMGLVKPKIYLPSNLDGKYKEYVIAHERAHLKRRDYIWKLLAFFMLTVHWFNPLIWVAYTMLCRDIEFACDEKVIKIYGEAHKANYSEALLNCSVKRRVANINPLAFGEVSVKDRIINILNYKKPSIWISVVAMVLVLCLTACLMTDPVSEKKTDAKEKVETVVSDDEKENTSDTSSKPSTTDDDKDTESKPDESKPEDTSSKQESKPEDTSSTPSENAKPSEDDQSNNTIPNDVKIFYGDVVKIYEKGMLVKRSDYYADTIPYEYMLAPFEYAEGKVFTLKKFRGGITIYYDGDSVEGNPARPKKIYNIYEYGNQYSGKVNGYEVATLETRRGFSNEERNTNLEPFCKDKNGASIYLIKSVEELKKYLNADDSSNNRLLKYYDEEFFNNYALVIRNMIFGTGGYELIITDVSLKNSNLTYKIDIYVPQRGITICTEWATMVEIPKAQLKDITYINTETKDIQSQ